MKLELKIDISRRTILFITLFLSAILIASATSFSSNQLLINQTTGILFGNTSINTTTIVTDFLHGNGSNITSVPATQLTGIAPLAAIPTTLTGKDADTTDGYHLNQGVRNIDSPTFASVNSSYYNTSDGRELQNGGCDASYCIRYNLTDGTTIEAVNGTDGSRISGADFVTILESFDLNNKVIVISGGTYESTNTNTIDSNNITIKGIGKDVVYINNSGSSHRVFTINGNNVTISDLTINANEPTVTGTTGYVAFQVNGNNANVQRIKMLDSGNSGFQTTRVTGFTYNDIEIFNNLQSLHDGINIFYSDLGTVSNIRCWTGDDCVAIKASSNVNINNIERYGNGINPVIKVRTWMPSGEGSVANNININNIVGNNTGWGLHLFASNSSMISNVNANNLNFNNLTEEGIEIRNQDANNTIDIINFNNVNINKSEDGGVNLNGGVTNLNINNLNVNQSLGYGMQIKNTYSTADLFNYISVNNFMFKGSGVRGIDIYNGSNIKFSNGYVINSTGTSYGVNIEGNGVEVELNHVNSKYNVRDGLYTISCINCNISVIGGSYSNNYRDGMRLGNNTRVHDAEIKYNAVQAITLLNGAVNVTFIDNVVLGNAAGISGNFGVGSVQRDNYGLPPYRWGNYADCTTITAFGAMDSCGNTTLGLPMWWNGTFWVKADGTRP